MWVPSRTTRWVRLPGIIVCFGGVPMALMRMACALRIGTGTIQLMRSTSGASDAPSLFLDFGFLVSGFLVAGTGVWGQAPSTARA